MIEPTWQSDDGATTLHHGDCLSVMAGMDANSVDLIVTDPPYFKVKSEAWDRQWDKPEQFLAWIGQLGEQWHRILKPNGSIYCFASPKMSWAVEGKIRERFNVVTNIRWRKPPFSTKAEMFVKEDLRSYFPASETIIFAEQFEATSVSRFAEIMDSEMRRLGLSQKQVSALELSRNGNSTGWVHNKLSGKQIPTRGQWSKLCELFGIPNRYERLLGEHEHVRRPFNVTADVPYTDVWEFPTVPHRPGKHSCEKPLALMEHMVRSSSRADAVVLDCFAGSGVAGEACFNLGRRFVGIEKDEHWFGRTKARIQKAIAARSEQLIPA